MRASWRANAGAKKPEILPGPDVVEGPDDDDIEMFVARGLQRDHLLGQLADAVGRGRGHARVLALRRVGRARRPPPTS